MLATLRTIFRQGPRRIVVATLYARIAEAARRPGLYIALGVPDTLEGRFESLSLHMVLALRSLRGRPAPADEIARDLTDAFFRDLDASLREMGVGDTRVPKRIKSLAEAFFGRAGAYDPALDAQDGPALAKALARNVLGGDAPAVALASYAFAADRNLKAAPLDEMLSDGPPFPKSDLKPGKGLSDPH